MIKPLVVLESPWNGGALKRALHQAYLDLCLLDSINRGECPFATHKLYATILDDNNNEQRDLGMSMLHTVLEHAAATSVYFDLGISPGMRWGVLQARSAGKPIQYRSLFGHKHTANLSTLS